MALNNHWKRRFQQVCNAKRIASAHGSWAACCLVVTTLTLSPVEAAENNALTEDVFLAELPVVLSASRLSSPINEAPAAVTVIDRQMIEASGVRNLSEVFSLVPGFLVGFASGHEHVVTYHGLADKFSPRLQVLVDGRSVYLPSFGGVAWSDLPLVLDDIERIEVIRGPNAVTYGANAFLATINIITRHSASDPGGFVRISAGSNHVRDGVLSTAGGEGNLHYRLTTAYQEDNGYAHIVDSRVIRELNGRIDYSKGLSDVEFHYGYNEGPRGYGESGSLTDIPRDRDITSRFEQLRWRYRFDGGGDVSLQVYHVHHEWDDRYQTLPIPIPLPPGSVVIPISLDVRSDRYDIEIQHTLSAWGPVRLVWGAGERRDENLSPNFLGTPDPVVDRLSRVFTNVEWRATGRVIVNAGAMYEKYDITGGAVSPRLAVNYLLTPAHTLRASASSANRQPVAFENGSNERICADPGCVLFDQLYLSSGNLRPEHIDSGELGYAGRFGNAVKIDLRVFHDKIYDLISDYKRPYPDPVNGMTFDFRNGGKATLFGSELHLQYQPQRGTRFILNASNTQIESNNFDNFYERSVPRNILSFLAMHDLTPLWKFSAAYYYQDRMKYIGGDPIDRMNRLDLRLAHQIPLAEGRAEVAAVLQNAAVVLQDVLRGQSVYQAETISSQRAYLTMSIRFR